MRCNEQIEKNNYILPQVNIENLFIVADSCMLFNMNSLLKMSTNSLKALHIELYQTVIAKFEVGIYLRSLETLTIIDHWQLRESLIALDFLKSIGMPKLKRIQLNHQVNSKDRSLAPNAIEFFAKRMGIK